MGIVFSAYSKVKQTTAQTGSTRWTHTEIAVAENELASDQKQPWNICQHKRLFETGAYSPNGSAIAEWQDVKYQMTLDFPGTKMIVSRFKGKHGMTESEVKRYQELAAHRVLMWKQFLMKYAS